MGYCFGGTTILELARSGADLKGFVSFHGGLSTPTPEDAKNIKGEILAFAGADDPFVDTKEVEGFEKEMRDGHVKHWELVKFGNAVHSFTNPEAGNDNSKGAAYNQEADFKSWDGMKAFFERIFKS
jgi:dienelactone hydrolase